MQVVPFENRPLVIFDIEGTSSKESYEDIKIYENRFALFTSALADVLIINFWCTDIKTEDKIGLLETVLAVNYKIYQNQESPTILAIFVRDVPSIHPPFEEYVANFQELINRLWAKIPKNNPEKINLKKDVKK
eukprot:GHVP01060573.1.p1 GENE.GHVP01060573.1~~GHVP01060573.1.p1  ORF type:complete len:133 (-),score=26.05 GHVP01060573.1:182-580(-)